MGQWEDNIWRTPRNSPSACFKMSIMWHFLMSTGKWFWHFHKSQGSSSSGKQCTHLKGHTKACENEHIHQVQWSPVQPFSCSRSCSTSTATTASPAVSWAAVLGEPSFPFLSKTSSDHISSSQGPQAQQLQWLLNAQRMMSLLKLCTSNLSPRCPLLPDPLPLPNVTSSLPALQALPIILQGMRVTAGAQCGQWQTQCWCC